MKESPLAHLPRRSMFVDAPVSNNPAANKRTAPNKRTRINEHARLEVAKAALEAVGHPAVDPQPLFDTTKVKGRGRPKVHQDRDAYRAEYMRKRRAAARASGACNSDPTATGSGLQCHSWSQSGQEGAG